MTDVRTHEVDAGGVTLHVEERGRGHPLLVLHGFTGNTHSVAGICEALASTRRRVLALDLIGHGASSAPDSVDPYRMDACVRQIHRVLVSLDALPADLLGYSMGGRAALCLLVKHPAALRSALLIGASAGIARDEERAARVAQDEALARRIEEDGLAAFVEHWMALPLFASQARRLSQAALDAARQQRLANQPQGLANSLRGMGTGAQPPLHADLGCIQRPVLFAVGDEDAKFGGIARDLASRMQNARVAVVPEAGHAAHLENPAAFGAIAHEFLQTAPESAWPQ